MTGTDVSQLRTELSEIQQLVEFIQSGVVEVGIEISIQSNDGDIPSMGKVLAKMAANGTMLDVETFARRLVVNTLVDMAEDYIQPLHAYIELYKGELDNVYRVKAGLQDLLSNASSTKKEFTGD